MTHHWSTRSDRISWFFYWSKWKFDYWQFSFVSFHFSLYRNKIIFFSRTKLPNRNPWCSWSKSSTLMSFAKESFRIFIVIIVLVNIGLCVVFVVPKTRSVSTFYWISFLERRIIINKKTIRHELVFNLPKIEKFVKRVRDDDAFVLLFYCRTGHVWLVVEQSIDLFFQMANFEDNKRMAIDTC